ncbi:MAG: phage holin family protein [Candidatus Levybacteria bacterium]|nr:phage holin family protein [Candidatus Levybacteria bacterium]
MKGIIRNLVIHTIALFLLPFVVPGVTLAGGLGTLIFAGVMLTLMMLIVKPILDIISFPFNVMTLGLFSIFTNSLVLYLLTVFVNGIIISGYRFGGADIGGFIIPAITFNTLFAFLAAAFVLSLIITLIKWLIE